MRFIQQMAIERIAPGSIFMRVAFLRTVFVGGVPMSIHAATHPAASHHRIRRKMPSAITIQNQLLDNHSIVLLLGSKSQRGFAASTGPGAGPVSTRSGFAYDPLAGVFSPFRAEQVIKPCKQCPNRETPDDEHHERVHKHTQRKSLSGIELVKIEAMKHRIQEVDSKRRPGRIQRCADGVSNRERQRENNPVFPVWFRVHDLLPFAVGHHWRSPA